MAIITKTGTPAKGDPLQFDLNKTDLQAHSDVQANGYFSDQDSWQRVVLEFRSSYDALQSFMVAFDGQAASPSETLTLPDTFKGNFEIYSLKIAGFNGDSLEILRADLTTANFDIDCSLTALPEEQIVSKTSDSVFDLGGGKGALFAAGHRVRLYNTNTTSYEGSVREIDSIATDEITLTQAFDISVDTVNHELHFASRDDCNVDQQVNWLFT